jgi:hypothetical protein
MTNQLLKRPLGAALICGILLTWLSGCEVPENSVGKDLLPEEDLFSIYRTDTLSLIVRTIREDSLKTDETSLSLCGNMLCPVFGQTGASFYSQVRLGGNNPDFGNPAEIIVDSLVLVLAYDPEYFGNLVPMSFALREVTVLMNRDSVYYSTARLPVLSENLIATGEETKEFKPGNVIVGNNTVQPTVRFRLKEDLAWKFINASGTSNMTNNVNFVKFFRGVHLSCNTINGAIIRFNLLNQESRIRMYYRRNEEDTERIFNFNLNSECARFNAFEHGHDVGQIVGVNQEGGLSGNDNAYIQAASGTKLTIEIPHLEQLNQYTYRTINKAELIIPVSALNSPKESVPERIFLLREAADGSTLALADQLLGLDYYGGAYEPSKQQYSFRLTRHVQAVLNGIIPNGPLVLVSGNSAISARRVILNGPDNQEMNMKLVVTFTE